MAFYTLPPFLLPNTPDANATEQERQEWRERISGFLRQSSQNIEELGEAFIGSGAQLADLVVDTAHINDAAITTAKIDSLAVTSAEIADASITTAKIVNAAITTAKIGNLQVTGALIAEGTITAAKIQANTITAAEIAAATITATEIAANTITVDRLTVGNFDNVIQNPGFELSTAHGATTSIGWNFTTGWTTDIGLPRTGIYSATYTATTPSGNVQSTRIPITPDETWYAECWIRPNASNTTGDMRIQVIWYDAATAAITINTGNAVSSSGSSYVRSSVSVTAPALAVSVAIRAIAISPPSAGGVIRVDDFYARRKLGGAFIEDAAITNAHIEDATILSAKIANAQISTAHIIDLNVTGAKIADATITTAKIGTLQVTGALIATGTITAAKIAANTITAAEIAAGTITAAEIEVNSLTVKTLTVGTFGNEIQNPGFEFATAVNATSTVGWTFSAGWDIDINPVRTGVYCALLSSTATSANIRQTAYIPATQDDTWYAEAWIRPGSNNTIGDARIQVLWYDAATVSITINTGNAITSAGASYVISSVSATAPAGTAKVRVRVLMVGAQSAGGSFRVDDFYARRKAGTAFIENAAITTALIANAAITTALIDNAAITTALIGNAQITTAKIANLAVGTALIADAAITTAKIGAAQITTALIANAAITTALIANAAITTAKIGAAQITTALIANAAITTALIGNGQINNALIANAAITTAKIGAAQITTALIANAAITTALIANAAIVNALIANASITTAKIVDASITTAKIVDSIITTAKIADASITTAKIQDLSVSTAKIANLAVGSGQIGNLAVSTAKIATLAVTTATIGNLQVSTLKVGDNQITTAKRVNVSSFSQTHSSIAPGTVDEANKTHNLGQIVNTSQHISSRTNNKIVAEITASTATVIAMAANNLASSGANLNLTWIVYYW